MEKDMRVAIVRRQCTMYIVGASVLRVIVFKWIQPVSEKVDVVDGALKPKVLPANRHKNFCKTSVIVHSASTLALFRVHTRHMKASFLLPMAMFYIIKLMWILRLRSHFDSAPLVFVVVYFSTFCICISIFRLITWTCLVYSSSQALSSRSLCLARWLIVSLPLCPPSLSLSLTLSLSLALILFRCGTTPSSQPRNEYSSTLDVSHAAHHLPIRFSVLSMPHTDTYTHHTAYVHTLSVNHFIFCCVQ